MTKRERERHGLSDGPRGREEERLGGGGETVTVYCRRERRRENIWESLNFKEVDGFSF